MESSVKRWTLLLVSVCVVLVCLVFMLLVSGFSYEMRKYRALVLAIVLAVLFQFFIGDVIKFACYAMYFVCRQKPAVQDGTDMGRTAASINYESEALLKLQLASDRAQMSITKAHYNESLNLRYKMISLELRLFGRYFVFLLILVVNSRDYLLYYNTDTLTTVLEQGRLSSTGLLHVHTIEDVHEFLKQVIVQALNDGRDYDGNPVDEPGWVQYHIAKLLGVVRLRQVRRHEKRIGLESPKFEDQHHNPRWNLPYHELHYLDKYWRTYGPWLDGQTDSSWLTPSTHYGRMYDYAEDNGYVVLLSRDKENSLKVLDYIRDSGWVNDLTVALFIDFTLYNIDSNIFSVCTLMVEYTPFGNVLSKAEVRSAELLMNLDNISGVRLFYVLLYMLQLIQFSKKVFLDMWHRTKASRSAWNYVDMTIIALNVIIFIAIITRELKVGSLMEQFHNARKLEFVDFRVAAQLDDLTAVLIGLLICLTTLRLWKVLQFAKPFRTFTRTLYNGRISMSTLMLMIFVYVYAFGICSYIVNGNDTEHFVRLVRSFTSSMSYAFGFSSTVSPTDLTHGGLALGFILYALLMFIIAILLLNLFITLICEHFGQSKDTPDDDEANELSFFEFLKVENAFICKFFKRCCQCCRWCTKKTYDPAKGTVTENIDKVVDKVEREAQRRRLAGRGSKGPRYGRNLRNIEQVRMMARILKRQVALMNYYQRRRARMNQA